MPTTLEQLAASLLGADVQKEIAEANPYYDFAGVGQSVSDLVTKSYLLSNFSDAKNAPSGSDVREAALIAGLGGLTSGLLKGFGNDYQSTLTDRYLSAVDALKTGQEVTPESAGLSDGLFGSAKRQAALFKRSAALDAIEQAKDLQKIDQTAKRQLENQILADESKKNPKFRQALIAKSLGIDASLVPVSEQPGADISAQIGREGGDTAATRQLINTYKALEQIGGTPSANMDKAYQLTRPALDKEKRVQEDIDAERKVARETLQLAQEAGMALGKVGMTGGVPGEIAQSLAGWAAPLSTSQSEKFSAGKDLERIGMGVVTVNQRALKGPSSDNDVKLMLSGGPSVNKTEASNQEVLNKWLFVSKLQNAYADFMTTQLNEGRNLSEAEKAWASVRARVPYAVKVGDEWMPNTKWEEELAKLTATFGVPTTAAAAPTQADLIAEARRRGLIK